MRYLLMVLAAVGWLLMMTDFVEAQEIHRGSFVGAWCLGDGEGAHTEVYTSEGSVVWAIHGVQYRGIWYWLPMTPDHFMVELGSRRILLRVSHVDATVLQVQDVRTGEVRQFRRGLCATGG